MKLPGGLAGAGTICLIAGLLVSHSSRGPGDEGSIRSGTAGQRSEAVVPPSAVQLPDGDHIPVVPIGVARSGTLEPPARVSSVGWWRGGAALGDRTGTVVLAGHVDASRQGVGGFAALWRARPGQTVRLRGDDRRDVAYRITGVRVYPRTRALPADIFAGGGGPRLALITCAGRFDQRTRRYSDTLVVYAVPSSTKA